MRGEKEGEGEGEWGTESVLNKTGTERIPMVIEVELSMPLVL